MQNLSKNKDLIIQKSDKGNSLLIFDRQDYINKINNILNDHEIWHSWVMKQTWRIARHFDQFCRFWALAKFLVPILKPLATNEFTEKVSFHFAEEIVDHQPNFFWLIWIEIPYLLT